MRRENPADRLADRGRGSGWRRGWLAGAAIVAAASAAGDPAPGPTACAGPAVETHYGPEEDLEAVDVGLIDRAQTRLDAAAYLITDKAVAAAMERAAARGVATRLILDPGEERRGLDLLPAGAKVRRKAFLGELMHLKSYTIDGCLVRTGSANLTAHGLTGQDNDLIVLRSPELAGRFAEKFEAMWRAAE